MLQAIKSQHRIKDVLLYSTTKCCKCHKEDWDDKSSFKKSMQSTENRVYSSYSSDKVTSQNKFVVSLFHVGKSLWARLGPQPPHDMTLDQSKKTIGQTLVPQSRHQRRDYHSAALFNWTHCAITSHRTLIPDSSPPWAQHGIWQGMQILQFSVVVADNNMPEYVLMRRECQSLVYVIVNFDTVFWVQLPEWTSEVTDISNPTPPGPWQLGGMHWYANEERVIAIHQACVCLFFSPLTGCLSKIKLILVGKSATKRADI